MATFLLVHGACTGGWCWEKVVPLLEAAGHKACAPDLPGLGNDQTPPANVTLADNVENLFLTGSVTVRTGGFFSRKTTTIDLSIDGTGNESDNLLRGNRGHNELDGMGGNDILLGGAGNDVMIGFAGDDHMDSDGGDDTIYGGAGSDFVHTGAGNDLYEGYRVGHESAPLATDLDEVHSGSGQDTLLADGGNVWLFGDSGNDFLSSRDTAPDQKMTSDRLLGGIGQDTLTGDAGDSLTGGSGADSFHVYAESESVDAPVVVEDFDPLVDKLALHLNYDAGLSTPSGQLTYEVDAALNRVVVSIDGVERLILGNTQCFDPRWVTLTMS